MQSDERGGRMLLGDDTDPVVMAQPTRFRCYWVWISDGNRLCVCVCVCVCVFSTDLPIIRLVPDLPERLLFEQINLELGFI